MHRRSHLPVTLTAACLHLFSRHVRRPCGVCRRAPPLPHARHCRPLSAPLSPCASFPSASHSIPSIRAPPRPRPHHAPFTLAQHPHTAAPAPPPRRPISPATCSTTWGATAGIRRRSAIAR
eukprot:3985943-Prymnesium_polylepis.1